MESNHDDSATKREDSTPPAVALQLSVPVPVVATSTTGVKNPLAQPVPSPEPKRIKLEETATATTAVPMSVSSASTSATAKVTSPSLGPPQSVVTASPSGGLLSTSTSLCSSNSSSLQDASRAAAPPAAGTAPRKSTTMAHLHTKYTSELEYMLREFKKLERQLLGAKGATQLEESAGSKERREKLHSFILHLEDTIRQIEWGCQLEAEGKTTIGVGVTTTSTGAANETTVAVPSVPLPTQLEAAENTSASRKREEEENVQKLEEHILSNLLPVKVRLKKQLAAQQGATKNPAGMPTHRRGMLEPKPGSGAVGTFAAVAEQRRKEAAEAAMAARMVHDPTQFGQPLSGGGSSLTQKLHGSTLGSKSRPAGHGVGSEADTASPGRKIVYAGMVPESSQHESGIATASGAHEMVFDELKPPPPLPPIVTAPAAPATAALAAATAATPVPATPKPKSPAFTKLPERITKDMVTDPTITPEERRALRKERRKRKFMRVIKHRDRDLRYQVALQQAARAQHSAKNRNKRQLLIRNGAGGGAGEKKGPRTVEYICSLCGEAYASTCEFNPWWALVQHECPKCRKLQVPRIDITSPPNLIEYHPALLAHADDNASNSNAGVQVAPARTEIPELLVPPLEDDGSVTDSDSDLSDISVCSSVASLDDPVDLTEAELAEHERFGAEYKGPKYTSHQAARLLILMGHASTCPCRHKNPQHAEVCKSTKFMMLHVRDCPGTTANSDVCPFPWCRKTKHLLYHLVSCQEPKNCDICNPVHITPNMRKLAGLNEHRFPAHREKLLAAAKKEAADKAAAAAAEAAAAAAQKKAPPAPAPKRAAPAPRPPTVAAPAAARPPTVAAPAPRPPTVAAPAARPPTVAAPATVRPPTVAAPASRSPTVAAPVAARPPTVAAPAAPRPLTVAAPAPAPGAVATYVRPPTVPAAATRPPTVATRPPTVARPPTKAAAPAPVAACSASVAVAAQTAVPVVTAAPVSAAPRTVAAAAPRTVAAGGAPRTVATAAPVAATVPATRAVAATARPATTVPVFGVRPVTAASVAATRPATTTLAQAAATRPTTIAPVVARAVAHPSVAPAPGAVAPRHVSPAPATAVRTVASAARTVAAPSAAMASHQAAPAPVAAPSTAVAPAPPTVTPTAPAPAKATPEAATPTIGSCAQQPINIDAPSPPPAPPKASADMVKAQ